MLKNYEAVEEQKTRLKVSYEEQKVVRNQEETEQMRATIIARKEAEVPLTSSPILSETFFFFGIAFYLNRSWFSFRVHRSPAHPGREDCG